jgi:DNA-binding transcriptional LysR family regulator
MDRLEAMAFLLRVVDSGSFSAASRELGVPLATVSRKVGELEAHLGTRLLTRSTRKVMITDSGAAYVASARGASSKRSTRPSEPPPANSMRHAANWW